jgi:hypothetical protein
MALVGWNLPNLVLNVVTVHRNHQCVSPDVRVTNSFRVRPTPNTQTDKNRKKAVGKVQDVFASSIFVQPKYDNDAINRSNWLFCVCSAVLIDDVLVNRGNNYFNLYLHLGVRQLMPRKHHSLRLIVQHDAIIIVSINTVTNATFKLIIQ